MLRATEVTRTSSSMQAEPDDPPQGVALGVASCGSRKCDETDWLCWSSSIHTAFQERPASSNSCSILWTTSDAGDSLTGCGGHSMPSSPPCRPSLPPHRRRRRPPPCRRRPPPSAALPPVVAAAPSPPSNTPPPLPDASVPGPQAPQARRVSVVQDGNAGRLVKRRRSRPWVCSFCVLLRTPEAII